MSSESNVEKELLEIVRDDLAVNLLSVDSTSRLIDDLGLDSVAFAVAIVAIEERLGVRLAEQDLVGCATLGDVVELIASSAAQPRVGVGRGE